MAETKKNTNSKKNNGTKKSTNTKSKNTTVKKDTKKVNDTVKESKKVTEKVVVEEKKKVKKEDSFIMKHLTDIMLVAAAVIVVIIGAVALGNKGNSVEDYLVKLNYNQYVDMQNSGEAFAFIVESATCVHCQNFMPVVKKFANNNEVYVYYIDLNELSEEDYTAFLQSNTFFEENENWGTPTTLIINGHEVSDSLVGETTEDKFKEFLVKNGIME